jgi:glutamine synthetase
MKLDRNIPGNKGRGKYAILNLRKIDAPRDGSTYANYASRINEAIRLLEETGILEWGNVGSESEFFLIKLKDQFSTPALKAYASAAEDHDFEYACEVRDMAMRSGKYNPFCKLPD